jgi:hypothetical protein
MHERHQLREPEQVGYDQWEEKVGARHLNLIFQHLTQVLISKLYYDEKMFM